MNPRWKSAEKAQIRSRQFVKKRGERGPGGACENDNEKWFFEFAGRISTKKSDGRKTESKAGAGTKTDGTGTAFIGQSQISKTGTSQQSEVFGIEQHPDVSEIGISQEADTARAPVAKSTRSAGINSRAKFRFMNSKSRAIEIRKQQVCRDWGEFAVKKCANQPFLII